MNAPLQYVGVVVYCFLSIVSLLLPLCYLFKFWLTGIVEQHLVYDIREPMFAVDRMVIWCGFSNKNNEKYLFTFVGCETIEERTNRGFNILLPVAGNASYTQTHLRILGRDFLRK